jgi:hypothetical protein
MPCRSLLKPHGTIEIETAGCSFIGSLPKAECHITVNLLSTVVALHTGHIGASGVIRLWTELPGLGTVPS